MQCADITWKCSMSRTLHGDTFLVKTLRFEGNFIRVFPQIKVFSCNVSNMLTLLPCDISTLGHSFGNSLTLQSNN